MLIEMLPKDLFDRALHLEYGLRLTLDSTYDARRVRRKLYAEREKLRAKNVCDYDILSFIIQNHCELWIIQRDKVEEPASVEFLSINPLNEHDLPKGILSPGKRRVGVHIY